jgi:hypothetical protein
MRLLLAGPLLVVLAGLSGCGALSGHPIDAAAVASFRAGETTEAQVRAALGAPNSITELNDGTHVLGYAYTRVAARPETFIPIIGPLVGGADAKAQSVAFVFSQDGVLRSKRSRQVMTSARTF